MAASVRLPEHYAASVAEDRTLIPGIAPDSIKEQLSARHS